MRGWVFTLYPRQTTIISTFDGAVGRNITREIPTFKSIPDAPIIVRDSSRIITEVMPCRAHSGVEKCCRIAYSKAREMPLAP